MSLSDVRSFWDARPCNIRHSSKEVGTKEYFDEVEARKYTVEPHIPAFASFSSWEGKRVLEVGCGIGTDTINFARAGARVTAVDLSRESLQIARQRAEVFGVGGRVRFFEANAEELASALPQKEVGEGYDLVYSFGVLHHTPNPRRAVEELAKLVKPGVGELRIMVYSLVSYKAFHFMHHNGLWKMGSMRDTIPEFAEAQTGCPVSYVYDFEGVRDLLAPWFEVQQIWKDHIFTYDIEEYKRGKLVADQAWEGVGIEERRALERELGWHTLVVAKPTPGVG